MAAKILSDVLAAVLLGGIAAFAAPRLMPRLKRLPWTVVFLAVAVVTGLIGVLGTPLGTPLFDAAVLVGGMFATVGVVLLVAAQRKDLPPVTKQTPDGPAPDERRWAAIGMAFSYMWFALLFLVLIAVRWIAYA